MPQTTFRARDPEKGWDENPHSTATAVERQNLTFRKQMRRLTRLTNAFSKECDNLWAAYCLHFAWYNFVRIHMKLRVTLALEAGITAKVWTLRELLEAA